MAMTPDVDGPAQLPSSSAQLPFSRAQLPFAADRRDFELAERLDGPCTFAQWRAASRQLATINRLTHAYTPAIELIAQIVKRRGIGYTPLHVVDLGCGSGDLLRAVHRWASRRSVALKLTGVDSNPYAARAARDADRREGFAAKTIGWITGDLFTNRVAASADTKPDIVLSSLVAHHLSSEDIARLLLWCEANAGLAWLLTDLRRSQRAHDVFAFVSRALHAHPFLQHDGPISFRRALSLGEWRTLLDETHLSTATELRELAFAKVAIRRLRERI
jgi:SAM-dependent methyltransferase